MKAFVLIGLLALSPAVLAQSTSASHYGRGEVMRAQEARLAEVLAVREVVIENDRRLNAGAAVGATLGYGMARNVRGNQRQAARIAGGALGGLLGNQVGKAITRRRGVELFVRELPVNGHRERYLAIVQEAGEGHAPGDLVILVGHGSKLRVVPAFKGHE